MPEAYLDADEIRAGTFIRHVEIHDTLGSTNDRAAELARNPSVALPALIAARHQTAGRGRGKNVWWSSDGALTFSILLDPTALGISAEQWPKLSLTIAVAICDALSIELEKSSERAGASPPPVGAEDSPARSNPKSEIRNPKSTSLAIKWPNDVMLDGAKICGILIESPALPAKDRLIIGIGINVNNSLNDAACGLAQRPEKLPNATSLCKVTGLAHNLHQLLITFLRAFKTRSNQLAANDPQLPSTWQQLCWLSHQSIEVQSNESCINGVCLGIDSDGSLLLENAAGTHRIHSGSVRVKST